MDHRLKRRRARRVPRTDKDEGAKVHSKRRLSMRPAEEHKTRRHAMLAPLSKPRARYAAYARRATRTRRAPPLRSLAPRCPRHVCSPRAVEARRATRVPRPAGRWSRPSGSPCGGHGLRVVRHCGGSWALLGSAQGRLHPGRCRESRARLALATTSGSAYLFSLACRGSPAPRARGLDTRAPGRR